LSADLHVLGLNITAPTRRVIPRLANSASAPGNESRSFAPAIGNDGGPLADALAELKTAGRPAMDRARAVPFGNPTCVLA
jgi:hypothetical protein